MTVSEIRKKYLDFFRARGHMVVPSSRLVPENDPTTLFTGSGMQPMIPYLLGQPHPQGTRVADSQKSFRAGDIEEVGDNRHTTFFEMLGNWSFGDYFKDEQIRWMFEFLTDELKIDPQKLYFTCYAGNTALNLPKDTYSAHLWQKLFKQKGIEAGIGEDSEKNGMRGNERIFYYPDKKNWWSRVGVPENMPEGEPGGPDTEMFYDFGVSLDLHEQSSWKDEPCHVNCDCGRFMEIGNNVFMEYVKKDGVFQKLPKPNVDFGGGLERLLAAANGKADVFLIDTFQLLIRELAAASGKNYNNVHYQASFRIVSDHLRAAVFMLGDGIMPSNTEQGYVLRRLIRRAVRHADKLGIKEGTLGTMVERVIASYEDQYPELSAAHAAILSGVTEEEKRFRKTLERGMKKLNILINTWENGKEVPTKLPASIAFDVATTDGFPYELVVEVARERGFDGVEEEGFKNRMRQHQDESRTGAAQKFAGGLADHQEQTIKYHTTHHLLLRALREVLGEHVHQRGSNITSERLRIDFSHPTKMTPEEKTKVEELVNQKIAAGLPVIRTEMPRKEAEKLGAEHEFGVKYPDMVSVYSVGPYDATEGEPKISEAFSLEFCGGPHVTNTEVLGADGKRFKIQKEEAVAQGIRRIKAALV